MRKNLNQHTFVMWDILNFNLGFWWYDRKCVVLWSAKKTMARSFKYSTWERADLMNETGFLLAQRCRVEDWWLTVKMRAALLSSDHFPTPELFCLTAVKTLKLCYMLVYVIGWCFCGELIYAHYRGSVTAWLECHFVCYQWTQLPEGYLSYFCTR